MAASRLLLLWLCALFATAAGAAAGRYPCCTCGEHGLLQRPEPPEPQSPLIPPHWNPLMDAKEFCDSQAKKIELQGIRLEVLPDCLSPFAVEVNVSGNRLTTLPGAAQLNPLLVVLDASRNNISAANDELRTLSALEVLRVEGNALPHLRFLPEPCALRRLHAADNALEALEGPLGRCALLEELRLEGNALRRLPHGAFFGLARLRELSLASNPLGAVPPRVFAGLAQLRFIDLGSTGLMELPQGVFEGLTMLEHVILSGNELTTLSGKVFSEQNLKSLDISNNEFTIIPSFIKRLPSLEVLNLGSNGINTIPEKFFRKNKRLRELSLSHNGILSLPEDALAGLYALQRLDLSRNPLRKLPEALLSDASALEALDVSRCPLESLSLETPLQQLARLDAMKSGMRALEEGALEAFPGLQCLNLQGSPLAALRPGAFRGVTLLRALFLGAKKGQLKQLPEDIFTDLEELEILDLHGHQLQTIPKELFKVNSHLLDINLDNNQIKSLPQDVFAGLEELQRLMLSNNNLKTVPYLRNCCGDLSIASFQNNSISHPGEEALLAILRGDTERVLDLRGNPVLPQALQALVSAITKGKRKDAVHGEGEGENEVEDEDATSFVRDDASCACGSVRRGRALLRVCVDAPCGRNDVWALVATHHA